jgi:hypothetical protein
MKTLRFLFIAGLSIALLATAAVEVVSASGEPTASIAKKKKCSKKKRKKGKCGPQADPVALITALLSGSSFTSTGDDGSPSTDGTFTDVFKFCRDGTYTRHEESSGTIRSGLGPIPFHEETAFGGTWKMTPHPTLPRPGELKGILEVTITSWQDSEGRPQYATEDSYTVLVPPDRSYFIFSDHPPWIRTAGGAGC